MIRVLVVEDSPVVSHFLVHTLGSDPDLCVVATAANGAEALEAVRTHRPDVITMDIHMPVMNGLEATRRIMERYPTPTVIVSSSVHPDEVASTFEALEAGAVAALPRPAGLGQGDHQATARTLIETVKLMAEVRVVRRWRHRVVAEADSPQAVKASRARVRAVAMGVSTGGPPVLREILSHIPETFPVPVLIVQHMAPGFIAGFVEWLANSSRCPVQVAQAGVQALPGQVYVAPENRHLGLTLDGRLRLSLDPPEHAVRPSVSYLFRSVTQALGAGAIGVLLTGMGEDGAAELKTMRDRGAITIAQDEATSLIFGMPGEAVRLGAATYVLPAERIAGVITTLLSERGG